MNSVNLIGRLTKKPELRYTQSNTAVCEFSLAVNRIGQEQTDFITCVVWKAQAENLVKYQDKGSLIAVNGSLRVDTYDNEQGERRYKTYVLANNIEYLSSKKETQEQPVEQPTEQPKSDPFADFGQQIQIDDSDLPF